MRKILIPLAAVALIAGCKGKAPEAVASDAAPAASEAAVAALPALPDNPKATVKPEGTYSAGAAKLTLGADMSAELADGSGGSSKGKWAWYSDGKRILLTADKSVWAVADGALYKLASKDAPLTGLTAEQIWTKAP